MALGAAIRTILTADATLTGLVSSRIYPDMPPQGTTYPCIVYMIIATDPTNTKEGVSQLDNVRLDVNIYAENYDSGVTIAERVRTLLDGYSGTSATITMDIYFVNQQSGDYTMETGVFWANQTFEVQQKR